MFQAVCLPAPYVLQQAAWEDAQSAILPPRIIFDPLLQRRLLLYGRIVGKSWPEIMGHVFHRNDDFPGTLQSRFHHGILGILFIGEISHYKLFPPFRQGFINRLKIRLIPFLLAYAPAPFAAALACRHGNFALPGGRADNNAFDCGKLLQKLRYLIPKERKPEGIRRADMALFVSQIRKFIQKCLWIPDFLHFKIEVNLPSPAFFQQPVQIPSAAADTAVANGPVSPHFLFGKIFLRKH